MTLKIHTGDKARALAGAASDSSRSRSSATRRCRCSRSTASSRPERCFDLRRGAPRRRAGHVLAAAHAPGAVEARCAALQANAGPCCGRSELRELTPRRPHEPHAGCACIRPNSAGDRRAPRALRVGRAARDLVPALVGTEAHTGVVFEQWLAVTPFAAEPSIRTHRGRAAGAPAPVPARRRRRVENESLDEIRHRRGVARRARDTRRSAAPSRTCWIHGISTPIRSRPRPRPQVGTCSISIARGRRSARGLAA